MRKLVPDEAEIAAEYPEIGTSERTARLDVHFDDSGIFLSLDRPFADDARDSVRAHFDYVLFAEILRELAKTTASLPPTCIEQLHGLRDSVKILYLALEEIIRKGHAENDVSDLTPDEEVRLLHIME